MKRRMLAVVLAAGIASGCGSGAASRAVPEPSEGSGRGMIAVSILHEVKVFGYVHDIYLMTEQQNPSSVHELRQVTFRLHWATQPSWSPDGSKFLFVAKSTDHTSSIGELDASGDGGRRLTGISHKDSCPHFASSGKQIVFERDDSGSAAIWTMNADGSDQKPLTAGRTPTWSPDGQWIAFSDLNDIVGIHPDGTGRHVITSVDGNDAVSEPAWSPDGATIAYTKFFPVGGGDIGFEIWRVNPDGSNVKHLTGGWEPSWSPDSALIVYGERTDQGDRIGEIAPDGTGQKDLTPNLPESASYPAWQPLPPSGASRQRGARSLYRTRSQ
jgi:Tol biopolymer transport system component